MEYYVERLNLELANIMRFWQDHVVRDGKIATEIANDGTAEYTAPMGCVYISRILYGSSAACIHLKKSDYKYIADLAYQTLKTKLKNPYGGYYWAIDEQGNIIHDDYNSSFAQAFAISGLAEYYALTGQKEIKNELITQLDFVERTIKHPADGSYLDGYSLKWEAQAQQKRSLGTHLHLLEALMKSMEILDEKKYLTSIENIVEVLVHRFINIHKEEVYHQLELSWKPVPNETWLGHNAEVAWIVKKAAHSLKNKEFIIPSKEILIALANNTIERGFDNLYGGIFNRFKNHRPISTNKEWWPQAESVIAFLAAYRESNDKKFLSYAIRLLEYIDNTFCDRQYGEWYDSVSREGKPLEGVPKLHIWKSMYHNVRYCIEVSKQLQDLYKSN